MLHLQPRLRDLLLGGVLLPAVYCHSAGLHPHLRLPQDEEEEDHLRPGQRKGAAGLNAAVCGETVILFLFPSISFVVMAPLPNKTPFIKDSYVVNNAFFMVNYLQIL